MKNRYENQPTMPMEQKRDPYICPVCNGNGLVQCDSSTIDFKSCCICKGKGNKLIAEFYGKKTRPNDQYEFPIMFTCQPKKNSNLCHTAMVFSIEDMEFHSSWGWLMPVVEKIESIKDEYHGRFGVYISANTCTIQATNFRPDKRIPDPPHYFDMAVADTKLEAVWHVVVRFIKWYNMRKDE